MSEDNPAGRTEQDRDGVPLWSSLLTGHTTEKTNISGTGKHALTARVPPKELAPAASRRGRGPCGLPELKRQCHVQKPAPKATRREKGLFSASRAGQHLRTATLSRRLSTFPTVLVGANPKIGSCPGRTMGYVTPGRPGTLSAHLVKPPQTQGDAPENVISPGRG